MVPRVKGEEIQALVRERLVEEVVVKTGGWQGYSFLDGSPRRHEWLVPGSGKEAAKVFGGTSLKMILELPCLTAPEQDRSKLPFQGNLTHNYTPRSGRRTRYNGIIRNYAAGLPAHCKNGFGEPSHRVLPRKAFSLGS
jgi:hypothetical protein